MEITGWECRLGRMDNALRDFDTGGDDINIDEYISAIEVMSDHLTDEHVSRLFCLLQGRAETVEYGASFDIKEEVQMQIMAVRAMRNAVMPNGKVRPGLASREVKEVVTASSTLLNTLMKTHKDVMSFSRSRAIEEAVTTTVRTLPEDQQQAFFAVLEENLSAIE